MIRRPPRSTHCISSAASDVYKRQILIRMMKRQWRYHKVNKFLERFKGRISLIGKEGNVVRQSVVPIEKSSTQDKVKSYAFQSLPWERENSITAFTDVCTRNSPSKPKHNPLPVPNKPLLRSSSNSSVHHKNALELSPILKHKSQLRLLLHRYSRPKSRSNAITQGSNKTLEKARRFNFSGLSKKFSQPSMPTANSYEQCWEDGKYMSHVPNQVSYYTQEVPCKFLPALKSKVTLGRIKSKGRANKSLAPLFESYGTRMNTSVDNKKKKPKASGTSDS
eukprot:TRINITY_DN3344_c0_g5_i1.p1 TRINITY_DN3344_c0_g5~~TRINITY_DN3344_c0_g5_i1.p1  ORF type:complete len:286 (+),score=68.48 TRINITY_DN3344_c0_g5_i1:25-858(+)